MSEFRTYTLEEDRDLDASKARTVELKAATLSENRVLLKGTEYQIVYLQGFTDDDTLKRDISEFSVNTIALLTQLCLQTQNWRNFKGRDCQNALDAFLNADHATVDAIPLWIGEILLEMKKEAEVSEEESKN